MERRTLIAFILCLLIIIYYPRYLAKIAKPAPPGGHEKTTPVELPTTPKTATAVAPAIVNVPEMPEKEFTIETPLVSAVFSNYEGTIKQLTLTQYLGHNKKPVELISPVPLAARPLATSLFSEPVVYELFTEGNKLTYIAVLNNLKMTKAYSLTPDSYSINVTLTLTNTGEKDVHLPQGYSISCGTIFPGEETQGGMYLTAKHLIEGRFINDRPLQKTHYGRTFWSAVKNKYFVLVLKPQTPAASVAVKDYPLESKKGITSALSMPGLTIPRGEEYTETFLLYAGPKKYENLKALGLEIDALMDFGMLAPISKGTLYLLNFFYKIFHNYGIAIILLTILVRFLLYPLTLKSYKSMREMHKIQPYMDELRKKYKDDPKRLQKEMMLLYKEHKVNPFGGCLPMILQMPVMIALFTSLRSSIELRASPFILWIKDLSEPDMLYKFPNGFVLNILPLFMVATFFIQQKMTVVPQTTPQQQQQQKMMSTLMPVFMGFVFYKMPSGLVLYFTLSTLLGIFDQYRIQKKK